MGFTIHDILASHLATHRGEVAVAKAKYERVCNNFIDTEGYMFTQREALNVVLPGKPILSVGGYEVHEEIERNYMKKFNTIRIKRVDIFCDMYYHAGREPSLVTLSFYPTFPGWTCWAKNAKGFIDNKKINNLITGTTYKVKE